MKGKLIVIDGIDSSGKATQARLLVEKLRSVGREVEKIDFPRYGRPLFGELLSECLAGKHGDFAHLDPKIASTLYALDRFEATKELRGWLEGGKIVVADRFSSSNQIHQGGKIIDPKKREDFLGWIEKVEHDVLDIPRPDAIIYLRVGVDMSAKLLSGEREQKNGELLENTPDVVEKDRMYIERSFESAEKLATHPLWHTVNCVTEGTMRAPESIAEDVFALVQELV